MEARLAKTSLSGPVEGPPVRATTASPAQGQSGQNRQLLFGSPVCTPSGGVQNVKTPEPKSDHRDAADTDHIGKDLSHGQLLRLSADSQGNRRRARNSRQHKNGSMKILYAFDLIELNGDDLRAVEFSARGGALPDCSVNTHHYCPGDNPLKMALRSILRSCVWCPDRWSR
jgi:hypothetical protein